MPSYVQFLFSLSLGVSFADKIIDGFNKFISFIGKLFKSLFDLIAGAFNALLDFLEKPLALLYHLLDGIFYFFYQIFNVVVAIIKIFVASFQFIGSLILGVFRTIKMWLTINITPDTNFPSATHEGFKTVIDLVAPTGLLTIVPLVSIAFLWFYFVIKMIGLFGGEIHIAPFGRGSDK